MPIKDYTTKIDAARTAAEVQTILAKAGANGVAMQCLACHNARSRVTRTGAGDVDQLADEYYAAITGGGTP